MQRSIERFLTTHQGGLPRPADLAEMFAARQRGEAYDKETLARRVREAVADVVRQQVECGIDIVNDGELSKTSWLVYFSDSAPDSNRCAATGYPPRTGAAQDCNFSETWRAEGNGAL